MTQTNPNTITTLFQVKDSQFVSEWAYAMVKISLHIFSH